MSLGKVIALSLLSTAAVAQGDQEHRHHHSHAHDHGRGLSGHCKDGDATFEIAGKTFACKAEFIEAGGRCQTKDDRTPEEKAAAGALFQEWQEKKRNRLGLGKGEGRGLTGDRRRLEGCGGDW